MRLHFKVVAFSLMSVALQPVLAQSRAAVEDDIQRFSGEPGLSPYAEKMIDQAFADHSNVNAAKAGKHSLTFSEKGPNDTGVSLTMDPISGQISSSKPTH